MVLPGLPDPCLDFGRFCFIYARVGGWQVPAETPPSAAEHAAANPFPHLALTAALASNSDVGQWAPGQPV